MTDTTFTEDQIKQMVSRFLCWQLPENFSPDGGISFQKIGNEGTPYEYVRKPSGTNLLDATQAEAMVRHLLADFPAAKAGESADGAITAHDALVNALVFLMEVTEPPEKNCSCHIHPPCGDCVEYGAIRDAHNQAQTALELAEGQL